MNNNIEYYVSSFFSNENFENFEFIKKEDLEELYANYEVEIKKACCKRKRIIKNKYTKIIRSKFEEYSN